MIDHEKTRESFRSRMVVKGERKIQGMLETAACVRDATNSGLCIIA